MVEIDRKVGDDIDHAWKRQFVIPEEDRASYTTMKWNGGFRWFRSPNVVCLEHYRGKRQTPVQGLDR
jgi:hypothetical protein